MVRHWKVFLSLWVLALTINMIFVGRPLFSDALRGFFLNAPLHTFFGGLGLGAGVGCVLGLLASAWIRTHRENEIVYVGWGVEAVVCSYYIVVFNYLGSFFFYDADPPFNICHLLSIADSINCSVTAATFRVATDFFLFGTLLFWGIHYEWKTGKELRYRFSWAKGDPEVSKTRKISNGNS